MRRSDDDFDRKGKQMVVERNFFRADRWTCWLAIVLTIGFAAICSANHKIIINEIFTGSPDWIEIINIGDEPVDLEGWAIRSWTRAVNNFQFENTACFIPTGIVLSPGQFLTISDDPVGDCSITASPPFLWCAMESLAVSLESPNGISNDLAVVSGVFGDPDLESINGTISPPFTHRSDSDLIRRDSFTDNDSGTDWICDGESSACQANPGQEPDFLRQTPFDIRPPMQTTARSFTPENRVPSPGFESENIIILIVDGLRYEDAFLPETLYRMPNINGSLRSQGTFLTNFYNNGMTITSPAHTAILSGVNDPTRNNRSDRGNIQMLYPGVFEYYIKHLADAGMPLDQARLKTWQIYGKRIECGNMAASLHPQYGERYRSNIEFPDPELAIHQDIRTFNSVMEIMNSDHPNLMLINLAQTDEQGHLGTWDSYVYSFRKTDEMVDSLWRKIQLDPNYRDKTTLLVLTDHGRNDDDHGGYKHHGCPCKGCRHSFLLALGPDTPRNELRDAEYALIDLCPSIAAVFGFEAPFAEGRFIADIFHPDLLPETSAVDPSSLSQSPEISRSPVIASRDKTICIGWVENPGENTITLRTSSDGGINWGVKRSVVWAHDDQTVQWFDLVYADNGELWGLVTVSEKPSSREGVAEWLTYLINFDTGLETACHNVGKMGTLSKFERKQTRLMYPWSFYISKGDAPNFIEDEIHFSSFDIEDGLSRNLTVCENRLKCSYPDHVLIGETHHIAFRHFFDDMWNLSYSRSMDNGNTWITRDLINPTPGKIILPPQIIASGIHLMIVYSQMGDFGTEWNLMAIHSGDTGLSWSEPFALGVPGSSALEPVILERNGVTLVIWSRFREAGVDIAGRYSLDGGETWSSEQVLVPDLSSLVKLDVEPDGKDLLITWSEPFDGQQECRFKRIENVFTNELLTDPGVRLWLPDTNLAPGDPCACWITLQNPDPLPIETTPLIVLLEVGGQFFFWPSFQAFDYTSVTVSPGMETFAILDEFAWPVLSGHGEAIWFATLMTPQFTDFLGFYSFLNMYW